jgi:O-antigen ligase
VSILVRDTESHRALLLGFAVTCGLSAVAVVVFGHVGTTLQTSARPGGMTGGANTAARYFIISLVCVYYLYVAAERRRRLSGAALLALAGLSLMGLAFTVSRSGYLLGAACFGMLLLAPSTGTRARKYALLALLVALMLYAVPRGVFPIATSIPSAIAEGADTAGLRYSLWRAGWIMFRDNWFTGVGIGQFSANLPVYGSGLVAPRHLDLTPHSMYVQLLCETGVGGFLLFAAAAAASLKNLLRMATAAADTQTKMAGWVWMTILVLLLLGGITKTDFSDKLLWVALGVGFSRELELGPEIPS